MNKSRAYILITFIVILLSSCSSSIDDFGVYLNYLAKIDNGLVKEKAVAGIQMKIKYLPNDYLVYNELKGNKAITSTMIDNVKASYNNTITFMMIMGPDKEESFDITRVGVVDYQEFAQRLEEMNFSMKQYVNLSINGKEYYPELAQMESTYGLEQNRKILFVFKAIDEEGNKILNNDFQFVYADELFNTGINKFKFKLDDINKMPAFNFKMLLQEKK